MANHVGSGGVEDMQVPAAEDISEQLTLVAPICTTDGSNGNDGGLDDGEKKHDDVLCQCHYVYICQLISAIS